MLLNPNMLLLSTVTVVNRSQFILITNNYNDVKDNNFVIAECISRANW